jgi:integrase
MRLGECLAMRWTQFDATNKQDMITETVRRAKFGKPKTGERLIDLPDFLCEKLERHIRTLRKETLRKEPRLAVFSREYLS